MTDTHAMHRDSPLDWQAHEDTLWQFESRLRAGYRPEIGDYLGDLAQPDKLYRIQELIKIDLEYAWKAGQRRQIEEYIQQFPDLFPRDSAWRSLAEEELWVRTRIGDPPSEAELRGRFGNNSRLTNWLLQKLRAADAIQRAGPHRLPGHSLANSQSACSTTRRTRGIVPGMMIDDRYELGEEVGRGAFASVWRASDRQLNREVAIKMLRTDRLIDRNAVTRMLREARAVARLQHAGIVQVYEVGEIEEHPYIVSQFVDGPSLQSRLDSGPLSQRESARILRDVALALDHAHQHSVIHRDVKPANILLRDDGIPMITDFGLAHHQSGEDPTLTQVGDILGTPAYMAPEQARGDNHLVDARTDVYAMGAALYSCLLQRLPFEGSTASVLNRVIHERPLPPRRIHDHIDRDLETITLKCLEKDFSDRYHSARALADDLTRYLHGETIIARRANVAERMWRFTRRNPRLAALIAALLTLSGFLLGSALQLRIVALQRDRAQDAEERAVKSERETQQLLAESAADAGLLALQRGRFDAARGHIAQSLRRGFVDAAALKLKDVEALYSLRRYEEASRALAALQTLPVSRLQHAEIKLWQAELFMQRGGPVEAVESQWREALDADLTPADSAYARGVLADSSIDALAEFREAIRIDPYHFRARRLLLTMLISLARFDEAKFEIVAARQLFEDDAIFVLFDALVTTARGQLAQAEAMIHKLNLNQEELQGWSSLCHSVDFLTQRMKPDWSHDLPSLVSITTDFHDRHLPLLCSWGVHFPPKLRRVFAGTLVDMTALQEGQPDPLTRRLLEIVKVHYEGSLHTLLGELQLKSNDVESALASFRRAVSYPAFISAAHTSAQLGIAAASLLIGAHQGKDPDRNLQLFLDATRQIDPQQVDPKHGRLFVIGAITAQDYRLAETWLKRWATFRPEDAEHARRHRTEILWYRLLLAQQGSQPLKVIAFADELLAIEPKHDGALGARQQATNEIRAALDPPNDPAPPPRQ
jgi:serine/threonine protein kinase